MSDLNHLLAATLEVFRSQPQRRYTVQEVIRELGKQDAASFKMVVKAFTTLEEHNLIEGNHEGRFKLVAPTEEIEGRFAAHEKGFGFVRLTDATADVADVFIPRQATHFAMAGDQVQVKIIKQANPWGDKGPEGEVTAILEHGLHQIVGEFSPKPSFIQEADVIGLVKSHDKKLGLYTIFIRDGGLQPEPGDMVQVELTEYLTAANPNHLYGLATSVLGNKNDPGVDVLSLVYQHEIRTEFPAEATAQAQAIPDQLRPEDWQGRHDLTSVPVVTIDGDDSKDFDDAVDVQYLANGHYHLGVHIADVSHYVTKGSPLDLEAFARGTSTYLTDRVIPMLPFRLSNGICSLNPHENRLALTCNMEINQQGQVVNYDIFPSVIQSKERMTYNHVNHLLANDDETLTKRYHDLLPMFKQMSDLHTILYQQRHARGAIDFEETEAQIKVDQNGWPVDIILRDRGIAERMIESFMLAANETVARHFKTLKLPFLYRVHERPDAEKIKKFFEFVSAFGIVGHGKAEAIEPLELQKALTQVEGKPEEMLVTTMLLRSLKQAHYSDEPLGHFGLGAKYYTHFTSPIRRYPDLIVHRLIHTYQTKGTSDDIRDYWRDALPEIAVQSSTQERRSVDTERDVDDLKKAQFMQDKVGQEFDGVVSSVTKFGLFISLPNTVEGLIHISNMRDDFYEYDETQMALVGSKRHHTYKIGQEVKIKVLRSDVEQRKVDFILAGQENLPAARPSYRQSNNQKSQPTDHHRQGSRDQRRHSKYERRR